MTVEEKAYNYASKVAKNRLTASEIAAHYGRGYIEGQEDMRHLAPFVCVSNKTWHPASELPKLKDGEDDVDFIVICDGYGIRLPFHATYCKYTGWSHDNVKWWTYPPEED